MHTEFWKGNMMEKITWMTGHTWKDNIKMDLKETGWRGMFWIPLAQIQEQVAVSCEHGREP
jgi:hypothetical protein